MATPLPTPQPSQSTQAQHDPDVEPSFSPILPLHRSHSDSKNGREKEKEGKQEVDEFDGDESEWQDAQIRESQMSSREDEGVWVDPLECILGALLAEEWMVIDGEEEGNDEWIDDDDWHSAETQDEWVEMAREPLSESRTIQQESQ
jgi:hypothetical protein